MLSQKKQAISVSDLGYSACVGPFPPHEVQMCSQNAKVRMPNLSLLSVSSPIIIVHRMPILSGHVRKHHITATNAPSKPESTALVTVTVHCKTAHFPQSYCSLNPWAFSFHIFCFSKEFFENISIFSFPFIYCFHIIIMFKEKNWTFGSDIVLDVESTVVNNAVPLLSGNLYSKSENEQ